MATLLATGLQNIGAMPSTARAEIPDMTTQKATVLSRGLAEASQDVCARLCGESRGLHGDTRRLSSHGELGSQEPCAVEVVISIEEQGAMVLGANLTVRLTEEARRSLRLRAADEAFELDFELFRR